MDGLDRAVLRRQSLKERLRLKGLGCCGPTWGLGPTTISVRDDDDEDEEGAESPMSPQITDVINEDRNPVNTPTPPCLGQSPSPSGMNLAAALAAERQFRAAVEPENGGAIVFATSPLRPNSNDDRSPTRVTAGTAPGTPARVSLMRLLEETDGYDGVAKKEEDGGGCDPVCCVCMGRRKGAAFIPCGHTFCRVCSRELWLNRGSCPLCNRLILEILDLY